MSKIEDSEEDISYICFNCLISIGHISNENNNNLESFKYIMRKECFNDFLFFRKINESKYNYLNISDSFFYIRDIDESFSIFGNNANDNEISSFSKEAYFSKNDRLKENSKFFLQHMISGKFVSCIMNVKNNKITFILVNDLKDAYPLSLELINKKRHSKSVLTFDNIFYLNVFIKEDNMNYYLGEEIDEKKEEEELSISEQIDYELNINNIKMKNKNNNDFFEIVLNRKPIYKICLINQTDLFNNKDKLFSGHLINIIFTKKNLDKEEKMMLCLKEKSENKFSKISTNIKRKVKFSLDFNRIMKNEKDKINFEVSACVYKEEIYEQVLNNALWIIEDNLCDNKNSLYSQPIRIGKNFRIRNALTGFYLIIKQKGKNHLINNITSSIFYDIEKNDYEFFLVDEGYLEENFFFPHNFKFSHSIINDECSFVLNKGKYILKGLFKNLNKKEVFEKEVEKKKFYFVDAEKYYLPISLLFGESANLKGSLTKRSLFLSQIKAKEMKKNNNKLIVKNDNENDFIFKIKKVDILKASQVLFIQKIIFHLEKDFENKNINIITLNAKIIFFIEYLLNIDYSFKDKDQEKNVPIKERQLLLWKFNIVNIICSFIEQCMENIKEDIDLAKDIKYKNFLESVKKFFNYLSKGEEAIKISIYVLALNKVIALEEILSVRDDDKSQNTKDSHQNSQDFSKLVYFIFDLVHHSETLQTYLIGEYFPLKKYIKNDSCLSRMNIDTNNLLSKRKFLELIENNPNFLISYQNFMILDKVQYRREAIIEEIKVNVEQIQDKIKVSPDEEKKNYLQIIDASFNQLKELIKNNVILLNNFLNKSNLKSPQTKQRKSILKTKIFGLASSIFKLEKKESNLKSRNSKIISTNNKEKEQSDKNSIILSKKESAPNGGLKIEEFEAKLSSQNTLNRLITQESQELNPKEEGQDNNIGPRKLSTILPKTSERRSLLTDSVFRTLSPKKKRSLKCSFEKKTKTQGGRNTSHYYSNVKNEKENLINKTNDNPFQASENSREYFKNVLMKLGYIWCFIKWYKGFEFKNLIFVLDDFLNKLIKNKKEDELIKEKKTLYIFSHLNNDNTLLIKNLKIKSSCKIGVLLLFQLYNYIFKKTQNPLEEKLSDKNISMISDEILKDMGEDENLDEKYSGIDNEKQLEEVLFKSKITIDENLSVFYSTYQFYINQYVLVFHKILKILSSFFINQETFESIEKIKDCFYKTLNILLSRVVFMNDNTISFLYEKAKRTPSSLCTVFNYQELVDYSINILINSNKNLNKNKSSNNNYGFLVKEKVLIDYLYSMCKECSEIKCLYEKISVLKFIRDAIFSKKMKEKYSEEEFNEKIKEQLKVILKLIWEKKRIPILLNYQKFNYNTKGQFNQEHKKKLNAFFRSDGPYGQVDFWENFFYESFKVGEITKFTLKLLKLYEIDEFFGNILFINASGEELVLKSEEKAIRKIRKLLSQILRIENQIININVDSYLKSDEKDKQKYKINDLYKNDEIGNLYYNLEQIQTDSLEIFNFDLFDFKSKNLLYKMLWIENKYFYKKIEFLKLIKLMIGVISKMREHATEEENKILSLIEKEKKKNNNIEEEKIEKKVTTLYTNNLGYVSNLLRIFSKIITMYPNFNETIKQNFEIYINLIISSFQCISDVPNNSIDIKVEGTFLEIMYRALDNFLYIIHNCGMSFKETKESIEKVFFGVQVILSKFKTTKNKYMYRIMYLLAICRILLYLYNEKSYDLFSYKEFYNNIFSTSEIYKYFISDFHREKTKVEVSQMEEIKEEEYTSKRESNDSEGEKNENSDNFFDLNNFPDEMHPVQLDNSKNISITQNTEEIKDNLDEIKTEYSPSDENEKNELLVEDTIESYDEGEIEVLSFYVSFLLVYSLYLNEKNSAFKELDEENSDNEAPPISEELSLFTLFKRLKTYLSPRHITDMQNDQDQLNDMTALNNYTITVSNITVSKNVTTINNANNVNNPEKNQKNNEAFVFDYKTLEQNSISEFDENATMEKSSINPQYFFIFSLLQAIINFKNSSRNNSIEIPIKQYFKKSEEYEESEFEDVTQNENDMLFDKNENNNSVLFYYYDSTHIDIILLEKIIIEIALIAKIKNYCLELADDESGEKPALLEELMKNLNFYKLMQKYQIKEYNLINNLFVKNNLSQFIKKVLTLFKYDDMKEISQMNYFMFKKMGEIYTHEEIKVDEESEQENFNLINFLEYNDKINNEISNKINILSYLELLIYVYPKYDIKTCLILCRIGFQIFYNKCHTLNTEKNNGFNENDDNSNLVNIIKVMTNILKKESYRILLEDNYVFGWMLLSLRELLKYICQNGTYFIKHFDLIKDFLNSLDFILGRLSTDFFEIVKFLQRPENLIDCDKFFIFKIKLEKALEFFISLLNFKTSLDEKILTEKIINFEKEIIKRVIKFLFLILEIEKEKSIDIINILINFLYEFIKGPDIDNLNIIFSFGFFDLASFVISKIDYYKLFLNYINKENNHEMIDNYIRIECKILKIFIVYYNASFTSKNDNEDFFKLQQWYENNFKKIEKKLKKLFYMSEKEMLGRVYSVNQMLLSIKEDDSYTKEEMCKRVGKSFTNEKNNDDKNDNKEKTDTNKNENNKKVKKGNNYCIIKFDLLLVYYTLFNYHRDLSNREQKFKFSRRHKKNFLLKLVFYLVDFLYGLFKFISGAISIILPFMYFIFSKLRPKNKKDVDYLQDLKEIEIKCESISEERLINSLKKYIRKVEVSIKNIIFKIYFPMIDKSYTLLEYRKEYLKVDEIDSSDFINYLLSKYDQIYIRAKQNSRINRWLWEIPILNYIFKNMGVLGVLIILSGLSTTFLILSSFNTFTSSVHDKCGNDEIYFQYAKTDQRIQCPKFLYLEDGDSLNVIKTFYALILLQCVLQGVIFIDYTIRTFFVKLEKVQFYYNLEKIKKDGMDAKLEFSKIEYIFHIIAPTFYSYIIDLKTLYYLFSLLFLLFSITVHPFFNCVILFEIVNRVEVMKTILKAMYRPAKNIFTILLMFIILEYFFSVFAQSFFTYHFPNLTDTKNFLKTFMRMIDQTFKQDGGIGTYLDKTLEPYYEEHTMTLINFDRLIFDCVFFLVVILLVFQMFLSVIIDYFNETREKSQNFNDEMESKCLVCGIDREIIEKTNPNDKSAFERHITNSHNVFNYIYYLMYLQSIDDKDIIIDDGVWNLHLKKNLSYLPKNEFFKNLERKRWKRYNLQNKEKENK